MSFATIIAAVMADVLAVRPGVAWRIGARWVADQQDAPPRIVWVPTSETFGPSVNRSTNPRQLLTCTTRFVVHVWGPDGDGSTLATEQLRHDLLASLYRVCHGYWPFEIGVGQWASEDGRVTDMGSLYLLEVSIQCPVTDVALSVVSADDDASVDMSAVMVFPGGSEPI